MKSIPDADTDRVPAAVGTVSLCIEDLIREFHGPVLHFIYRYVGDRDWAEDLTQEVFCRALRKADTFRGAAKPSTWLFTIARNLALDFARRRKVEGRIGLRFGGAPVRDGDGDDVTEHIPAHSETPLEVVQRRECERAVHEALGTLPEKYRAVILLCDLQGLSYEEASEVVGCPVKTISSRLSRARERFRVTVRPLLMGECEG